MTSPRPVRRDYDDDPGRSRAFPIDPSDDVHALVAARLAGEDLRPILDCGCGTGRLARVLPENWPWIGIDASHAQLADLGLAWWQQPSRSNGYPR